jgi:hypothetical protein
LAAQLVVDSSPHLFPVSKANLVLPVQMEKMESMV